MSIHCVNFVVVDFGYDIHIHYGLKTKIKYMQTEINYSPDQAFKIIKNAYDEAEASGIFKNNLIEAVKPERGQVIIEAKDVFVFDREAVQTLLEEEFPKSKYRMFLRDKQISITKKLWLIWVNRKRVMNSIALFFIDFLRNIFT